MSHFDVLKGKVVVVEGGELMGKSTLIRNLVKKLSPAVEVEVVAFPGTSGFGKSLRAAYIADSIPEHLKMPLMIANFAEAHHALIQPAADAGKLVLLDRHVASTYAYQIHYEKMESAKNLFKLYNSLVPKKPDVQVYLELDKDLFVNRQQALLDSGREIMANDLMYLHEAVIIDQGYQDIFRTMSHEDSSLKLIQLAPDQEEETLTEALLTGLLDSLIPAE